MREKGLSSRDAAFFSSQSVTRGGIGNLVASGTARGNMTRLPQAEKARRASARHFSASYNANSSMPEASFISNGSFEQPSEGGQDLGIYASVILANGEGVPSSAKHEWQKGFSHPYPFCPAARRVTIDDLKSPRWASISYFENNAGEVAKHISMIERDTHKNESFVAGQSDDAHTRYQTWASQQREIFNRQRCEKADQYSRSGMQPRPSYMTSKPLGSSIRPMTAPMSRSNHSSLSSTSNAIPLPKATHTKVYKRMENENIEMAASSSERIKQKAREASRMKVEEQIAEDLGAIERFEIMTLREVTRKQQAQGRGRATSRPGYELD